MDIRNWSLGQIMQLPDNCFGRRWPIITSREVAINTRVSWLVKPSLPDRCVLWELQVRVGQPATARNFIKVALGDHEPLTDAAFDALERIIPGDFENVTEEGAIYGDVYTVVTLPMRLLLIPQGRRFCVQAYNLSPGAVVPFMITFVVSSIPTEVPDCLLSV